jgi:RNA polymerase sigma-70 factor (ECF subfamily)
MGQSDKTSMGGRQEAFETTHWTEIVRVREGDEARRREALERTLARYWKPVYCYLRRKGYGNEEAKDLAQGFFHEVVLGRRLVEHADRTKGRFRTFLLTALCRYVTSVHRAEQAAKRMPDGGLASLDNTDFPEVADPACGATPEEAFDHAWASALLEQVIRDVQNECLAAGKAAHWFVFSERVLRPVMNDAHPRPLADLCAEYDIPDEVQASNMIVTVKRRFRSCLERHVRQMVDSDDEVEGEIRDLIEILSGGSAGG